MKRKGFSLIEIMIVVAVITLLFSLITPALKGYVEYNKKVKLNAGFQSVYQGVSAAIYSEGDSFPWINTLTPRDSRGLSFNSLYGNYDFGLNEEKYYDNVVETEDGWTYDEYFVRSTDETFHFLEKLATYMPKDSKLLWSNHYFPSINYIDFLFPYFEITPPEHYWRANTNCVYSNLYSSPPDSPYNFDYRELSNYTRSDGEEIYIRFFEPDDDPDTYSLILVPKVTPVRYAYEHYLLNLHAEYPTDIPGGYADVFYDPPRYSTKDLDIILFNEGYYTVNGGEPIELIMK